MAGTIKIDKIKSKGKIVKGATDLSLEFEGLTEKTIKNLVQAILKEYKP